MKKHSVNISEAAYQKISDIQNTELKATGNKPTITEIIDKKFGIEKTESNADEQ